MAATFDDDLPDTDLSELESRALELIRETGGMPQSELWKELDSSSRTGSRIAKTLADEGLITRTETTYNGRKTYALEINQEELETTEQSQSSSVPIELPPDSALAKTLVSFLRKRGEVPLQRLDREVDASPQAVDEAMRELVKREIVAVDRETLYGREQDVLTLVEPYDVHE